MILQTNTALKNKQEVGLNFCIHKPESGFISVL